MSCKENDPIVGCYTADDGTRQNVAIHYEYGVSATGGSVLAAVRITDAGGAIVAGATAENTTPGACPVAQPDVEWVPLCDVQDLSLIHI